MIIRPMPSLLLLICSFAVFWLGAAPLALGAGEVELWNGTYYGMTEGQVIQAVAGVQRPADPNHLKDGATELLRHTNVTIADERYEAEFYFDAKGKLQQVTLSAVDPDPYYLEKGRFDSLLILLRKRYGQELSLKVDDRVLQHAEANFAEGDKNVILLLFGIAKNPAFFNIVYQVRLAEEAGKL